MTQKTLKEMILNVVSTHPKGYLTELAEIAGYTGDNRGSNFNRVLTNEKKEFDSFQGVLKLVEHLWEYDIIQKMIQFSKDIDPKKKIARNLLEYLAMNRQFEAFNFLIEKMVNCDNKESMEWARLYRMQYKYELSHTREEFETLLKEINQMHVTVYELKVYKNMLLNYCFDQLKDYNMVKMLSMDLESEIKLIENEYINEMYSLRTNEIMSYNYLKVSNNTEKARYHADLIISSNAKESYKAYAYYVKGASYMFTSYDKALKYLIKSKSLYQSVNRGFDVKDLDEEIEFLKIYWGKYDNIECSYIKNQLFLSIKKGDDISDELMINKDNIDTEMYLYLEGCNGKNNKKLMLSLIKFMKKSDLFLANLPKIELLKNGYDGEILDELITVNLA